MDQKVVHVSKMTGKLEGFRAINLNPVTSEFCQRMQKIGGTVCQQCYSQAMLTSFRKTCGPAFTRNANLMSESLKDFQIPRFMPGEYVRFLAHGDMDNAQQFLNFCTIAGANPETHFTMWTKRADLVSLYFRSIPGNMKLIQSSQQLNTVDARVPGFDAIFTVYTEEANIPQSPAVHRCNGVKCSACMYCYKEPTGHVAEILKKGSKKIVS